MHAKAHAAAPRGQQRQIARELQGVAKTLLGLHIDVPAREAFSVPGRLRKSRPLHLAREQAPFVFFQALAEFATRQQQDAEAGMGIGVMGRERERPPQRHQCLVEGAGMMQGRSKIGPGVGEIRHQGNGPAIGGSGLIELLQRVQGVAEAAMRLGEAGVGLDGAALTSGGFGKILAVIERGAEIVQRFGIVGLQRHGPAALGDRLLDLAGQSIHFAEIGMVERHLRRDPGGVADVPDRLPEIASLVRDQPQNVQRFRRIRRNREHAAASGFGLGEPASGAKLLGKPEQLGDRQPLSGQFGRSDFHSRHPASFCAAAPRG